MPGLKRSMWGLRWWSSEDSNEREVAVLFGVIKSVTDDEGIGDSEAGVVGLDAVFAVYAFLEEDAGAEGFGFEATKLVEDGVEGLAGIQDIVDEEDVAVMDIGGEVFGEVEWSGLGLVAVAGGAYEVEGEGEVEVADEVGSEDDGAIEDGDNDGVFILVVVLEGGGEGFDASGEGGGWDENGLDIGAPVVGDWGA